MASRHLLPQPATTTTPTRSLCLRPRSRHAAPQRPRAPTRSTYWDALTPDERPSTGPRERAARQQGRDVSCVGHQSRPGRHGARNSEMPPFPESTQPGRRAHRLLLLGARFDQARDRVGGRGVTRTQSSAEFGQRYLDVVTRSTAAAARGPSSAPSKRCPTAEREEFDMAQIVFDSALSCATESRRTPNDLILAARTRRSPRRSCPRRARGNGAATLHRAEQLFYVLQGTASCPIGRISARAFRCTSVTSAHGRASPPLGPFASDETLVSSASTCFSRTRTPTSRPGQPRPPDVHRPRLVLRRRQEEHWLPARVGSLPARNQAAEK